MISTLRKYSSVTREWEVTLVTCLLIAAFLVIFEWIWRSQPEVINSGDRWQVRLGIVAAVLLFANLIVLWRSTVFTESVMEVAQQQYMFAQQQDRDNRLACVTIEHVRQGFTGSSGEIAYYTAMNIGGGGAINVYFAKLKNGENEEVRNLGAFEAGGKREVFDPVQMWLKNTKDPVKFVLVTEAFSGPRRWSHLTHLKLEGEHEEVWHGPIVLDLPAETIEEYLVNHLNQIVTEADAITKSWVLTQAGQTETSSFETS